MSREILFKAKRKDNNEWVYGNLVYKKCLRDNGLPDIYYKDWIEKYVYIYEDNGENNIEEYPTKFVEVILETVCQYTGKNDNTGKKIFENDIVEEGCNGFISSVIYDNDIGTYKLKDLGDYYIKDASIEWKVIGNLFDEENQC